MSEHDIDMRIARDTRYAFLAGTPLHELIRPDGRTSGGRTYVMQAHSHEVDDRQTLESLETLGDRLELPEGWRYRVRTLDADQDLYMVPDDGIAHVVQDELQNTYMYLPGT
jgi:hypothetical protein